jgi:hypothetical protein
MPSVRTRGSLFVLAVVVAISVQSQSFAQTITAGLGKSASETKWLKHIMLQQTRQAK